jgi:predicted CXXCH cytochrome family protein
MTRTADGVPHLRVTSLSEPESEPLLDVDVDLTVGSHRYQQYVARIDRGGGPLERWRLPVAWHVGETRWIPMRAAFLTPDGTPGEPADYLRHLSRWSDNCIFCHNTEPAPGLREGGTFRPKIGEYGIACEACHGAASAHVARHRDPIRRLLSALDTEPDEGSILHPGRLDPALSADVCGRCHGQRIGRDIDEILAHGDGFVPGEPLASVSRPIFADSALAGEPPGAFAARFWPDDTPRLSAYEYQGLLASPCHDEGRGLTCADCHAMHGGDPNMQLHEGYDGDRVCARCHEASDLSGAKDSRGHGGHGDAVDCAGCHMPRTTYGLLLGMQSHRITVPDPAAALGHADRPDACTQCHVDRSRAWAAAAMGGGTSEGELEPQDTASRIAVDLLGGDPIQRALATHALARPESTGSKVVRAAWLVDALDDDYPAVRWMAVRALEDLAGMPGGPAIADLARRFDPLADPADRVPVVQALRERLGPGALADDPEAREALLSARDDVEIWIGE